MDWGGDATGEVQDLKHYKGAGGEVARWLKELELVKGSQEQLTFERTGAMIVKTYKAHATNHSYGTQNLMANRPMYNVLWSNVQILKPTYFSRLPKIECERRFDDANPVGRLACMLVERATSYQLSTQHDRFMFCIKACVEDMLLPGRGQVWLRFEAEFEEALDENGEPILDDEGNPIRSIKPNTEKVVPDYIFWQDYYESTARNPYETRWRARRVLMTRSEGLKRFGNIFNFVELQNNKDDKLDKNQKSFLAQAEVYEIADITSKTVYWVTPGYKNAPLDKKENPLRLKDFWPCPFPLLATTTTDSTYPTPDYVIYERLAEEVDYVTKRLSAMVECIRLIGATAAQFNKDVKNILRLGDGDIWPIANWASWAQSDGFKGAIDWMPFDQCVAAIGPLTVYRDDLLSKIDLITGIPDLMRGSSDPQETASAQQTKTMWVNRKCKERQMEVVQFCTELVSKTAEIIFEPGLFSDETIRLMCGVDQMEMDNQQLFPQALQLLRDDKLSTFMLRVGTDSTIEVDENEKLQKWMEYLAAVQNIVSEVQQVSQFRPELMHPMIESAKAAVRMFRTAKSVEGAWDSAWQKIEDNDAQAAMNPPQPPPDYDMMKIELGNREQSFKEWFEPQKLQADTMKAQMQFEIDSQKVQVEGMKVESRAQVDQMAQELDTFKANFDQYIEKQRLDLENYRVVLDTKEKFMEEARLRTKELEETAKSIREERVSEGKGGPVNIHLNTDQPIVVPQKQKRSRRKLIQMQRTPDGKLVGESLDIDDDEATT